MYSLNRRGVGPDIFNIKSFFLSSFFACTMKILNGHFFKKENIRYINDICYFGASFLKSKLQYSTQCK